MAKNDLKIYIRTYKMTAYGWAKVKATSKKEATKMFDDGEIESEETVQSDYKWDKEVKEEVD